MCGCVFCLGNIAWTPPYRFKSAHDLTHGASKGYRRGFFSKKAKCLKANKFFYAVPEGLVTKDEVPDYAGLIYIDCGLNAYKVKDAKFIHKEKLDATKVFNKMYYSYEREVIKKLMSS